MKIEIDIHRQEFEYVDLYLPSGTKWATCNVGAEKDTDFGDYLTFSEAQKYNCPSKEQIKELIKYTTSSWMSKHGVNGRYFVGKNGKYIFLPADGYRNGENLYEDGLHGAYWSSTPDPFYASHAHILSFDLDDVYQCSYGSHCLGFSVRPIKNK